MHLVDFCLEPVEEAADAVEIAGSFGDHFFCLPAEPEIWDVGRNFVSPAEIHQFFVPFPVGRCHPGFDCAITQGF